MLISKHSIMYIKTEKIIMISVNPYIFFISINLSSEVIIRFVNMYVNMNVGIAAPSVIMMYGISYKKSGLRSN